MPRAGVELATSRFAVQVTKIWAIRSFSLCYKYYCRDRHITMQCLVWLIFPTRCFKHVSNLLRRRKTENLLRHNYYLEKNRHHKKKNYITINFCKVSHLWVVKLLSVCLEFRNYFSCFLFQNLKNK